MVNLLPLVFRLLPVGGHKNPQRLLSPWCNPTPTLNPFVPHLTAVSPSSCLAPTSYASLLMFGFASKVYLSFQIITHIFWPLFTQLHKVKLLRYNQDNHLDIYYFMCLKLSVNNLQVLYYYHLLSTLSFSYYKIVTELQ